MGKNINISKLFKFTVHRMLHHCHAVNCVWFQNFSSLQFMNGKYSYFLKNINISKVFKFTVHYYTK